MTAISAPVLASTSARVGFAPRILAAAAALRRVARQLDALFAGAATAPSREVAHSLALLRINR